MEPLFERDEGKEKFVKHWIELFQNTFEERETDIPQEDGNVICGVCMRPRKYLNRFGEYGSHYVPTTCECDLKERRRIDDLKRARRVDKLRRSGLKQDKLMNARFETSDQDTKQMQFAKKYVEQWAKMKYEGVGIIMTGGVGTGKTHLACCIANALIDIEESCFIVTPSEINSVSQFSDERDAMITRVSYQALMILDDLGSERDSDYSLERLFEVVDIRAKSGKPLIVTSNLSIEQMQKEMNPQRRRIYDRVIEMCPIPITINGRSRRKDIANRKLEIAKQFMKGAEG